MTEEKWEHDSLRWLHEAREKHYLEEQRKYGKMITEVSKEAKEIMERLKLEQVKLEPLIHRII